MNNSAIIDHNYVSTKASLKCMKDIIISSCKMIDSAIVTACERGESFASVELNTVNNTTLDQSNYELIMYTDLIKIYVDERGFKHTDVKLEINKSRKVISMVIKWESILTPDEHAKRLDIFKKHAVIL